MSESCCGSCRNTSFFVGRCWNTFFCWNTHLVFQQIKKTNEINFQHIEIL